MSELVEKQKAVLDLALSKGLRADTRVDEVVAENAQETITAVEESIDLLEQGLRCFQFENARAFMKDALKKLKGDR